jgi:hypothetical protein
MHSPYGFAPSDCFVSYFEDLDRIYEDQAATKTRLRCYRKNTPFPAGGSWVVRRNKGVVVSATCDDTAGRS